MRIRDKSAAGRKKYRMMVIAVLLATVALSMSAFAGQWRQDDTGWWYQNKDGSYPAACWQLLTYNGTSDWYHFDEKGYMQTGWFTDTDGNRYYLHAVSDGTRGRTYTGWNLIDGVWYYFNPTSDGTKGALFMNRQTPDGYRVDASGAWVE